MAESASVPVWDDLAAHEVLAALERLRAAGQPAESAFLDAHQWSPLQGKPEIALVGGHPQAQFRRASLGVVPAVQLHKLDLTALSPSQRSPRALRRLLTAQLLPSPALGDLAVSDMAAVFCALPDWEQPELLVKPSAVEEWPPDASPLLTASLASLRLDAFVSGAFHISRSESNTATEHGYVFVNFAAVTKTSRHVAPGDQVVLRGKGRAELVSMQVNQRSGRSRAEYRVYLS